MKVSHNKTDFFLISGFLGSGKTTFLKHILNTLGEKHRIAIIQNEFAPAGIDGRELLNTGKDFNLIEINNGSVFCICQMSNFLSLLEKLLEEHNPEMIFLEASGLSDPVNILELLYSGSLKDKLILRHIYAIADALSFFKGMKMLQRFRHQLMIADTVLLNKTDLFNGDTDEIATTIRQMNPFANIIPVTFCEIPLLNFTEMPGENHLPAKSFSSKKPEGKPNINTFVLRTNEKISEINLNNLISELLPDYIRIKGFVNLTDGRVMAVQTVFDQVQLKVISDFSNPTEIIAFSQHMTSKDLKEKFKNALI